MADKNMWHKMCSCWNPDNDSDKKQHEITDIVKWTGLKEEVVHKMCDIFQNKFNGKITNDENVYETLERFIQECANNAMADSFNFKVFKDNTHERLACLNKEEDTHFHFKAIMQVLAAHNILKKLHV